MNRTPHFNGKLLVLSLALALTAVFVSCKNPAGHDNNSGIPDGDQNNPNPDVTYDVKFYYEGIEYPKIAQKVTANGLVTVPAVQSLEGHTFIAWYKEPELNNEWNFAIDRVTGNTNLYARFTADDQKVKVTFDLKEGKFDNKDENPPDQELFKGELATRPNPEPTKINYGFVGWFNRLEAIENEATDLEWDFTKDRVENDIYLYAQWKTHLVTFKLDGGTLDITSNPQPVAHGEKANDPGIPTYASHRFDGWWLGTEGDWGNKWDFDNEVTEEMTLTARWVRQYTVTFNPDGGIFDDPAYNTPAEVDADKPLENSPVVKKAGYEFDGWRETGAASNWNFETHHVTENITLIAQWIQLHRITFNGNGGTLSNGNSTKEVEVRDDSKVDDPRAEFLQGSKNPISWHTSDTNQDETNKWDFDTHVTAPRTLYAKYPELRRVTFITGKVGAGATVTVDVWDGEPINKDNAGKVPEAGASAKFLHWVDEADPGTWKDPDAGTDPKKWDLDTTPVTKDMRLRPKWMQFAVGDEGPSGGQIFYVEETLPNGFTLYLDANDTVGVQAHYLEAAPDNAEVTGESRDTLFWQTMGNVTNTSFVALTTHIGEGRRNTAKILADMLTNSASQLAKDAEAAYYAFHYDVSGTWFLPSVDEMQNLYSSGNPFGLPVLNYWTSNEGGYYTNAVFINTSGSTDVGNSKTIARSVRPIRAW